MKWQGVDLTFPELGRRTSQRRKAHAMTDHGLVPLIVNPPWTKVERKKLDKACCFQQQGLHETVVQRPARCLYSSAASNP